MAWITKDLEVIGSQYDLPDDCYGFVYRIDNLSNGKSYIGKKQCFRTHKKKFGKKRLAQMTDKRSKKYEMITKPSNWLTYEGSNKELTEDIKNGDNISKVILEFGFTKYHLTFLEVKHQFIEGVLESDMWYNSNILGKFYRSIFDFKNKEQE